MLEAPALRRAISSEMWVRMDVRMAMGISGQDSRRERSRVMASVSGRMSAQRMALGGAAGMLSRAAVPECWVVTEWPRFSMDSERRRDSPDSRVTSRTCIGALKGNGKEKARKPIFENR